MTTRSLPRTQRQITTFLGDRPADGQNAGPVLDPAARTVSPFDLALIWAGLQIISPTWGLGALATSVFGLDLLGTFTALLIGTFLGGSILGLVQVMGRVGAPQMLLGRYVLGIQGNAVLALVNFVTC